MSCAYFAKEVSYLIRAPIYNPPMFLISKYHAQTTWSGQPAVARLQLVEGIFFLCGFFFCFFTLWAIYRGELTAAAPLCFGSHQTEDVELEEFGHLDPEGKGSAVFPIPEILMLQRQSSNVRQGRAAACAVQRRPRQAPCFSSSALASQHLPHPHVTPLGALCIRNWELSWGILHGMSPLASRLQQSIAVLLTWALDGMQGEWRGEREIYCLLSLIRSATERKYSIQFT